MMTILMLIVTLQFSCVDKTAKTASIESEQTSQEVKTKDAESESLVAEEGDIIEESPIDEEKITVEKSGPLKKSGLDKKEELEVPSNIEKVEEVAEVLKTAEEVEVVVREAKAEETENTEADITKTESKETEIAEVEEAEELNEAAEEAKEVMVEEVVVAKPNHAAFDALLSAHVSAKGVVNYNGLKGDIGKLDAYLSDLDENSIAGDWSRSEKLAYWINAYNAFTIKLILDNYPVSSIQDIAGGKPWDKQWIKLGGKTYSLNQIENDIIRPQFKEPRIHFAVNCAAQSCPPLGNKAFTAENLNSLLEKQTKSFVNNSKYNTISANGAKVSKIFDWYGVDFGDKLAFLNKYSTTKIAASGKIAYSEYDWALNNK